LEQKGQGEAGREQAWASFAVSVLSDGMFTCAERQKHFSVSETRKQTNARFSGMTKKMRADEIYSA
jgi:hypothetical protein